MPTYLELCAGIGGLSLGLERAGWTPVGFVEIDPFCQRVLSRHWPDVPRWGDITDLPLAELPTVDMVCGGIPCQPVSGAGKQKGLSDPRWLWPHAARVVRHLRPRWVLVENVLGILTADSGRAAQAVFGDLSALGYDSTWFVLPAAAVGAPHLRKRVFIVAHTERPGPQGHGTERGLGEGGRPFEAERSCELADADSQIGRTPRAAGEAISGSEEEQRPGRRGSGLGGHWAVEPDVGRVAHGVPQRVDRLRALGNAVVPQCAELVGRWILAGGRPLVRATAPDIQRRGDLSAR